MAGTSTKTTIHPMTVTDMVLMSLVLSVLLEITTRALLVSTGKFHFYHFVFLVTTGVAGQVMRSRQSTTPLCSNVILALMWWPPTTVGEGEAIRERSIGLLSPRTMRESCLLQQLETKEATTTRIQATQRTTARRMSSQLPHSIETITSLTFQITEWPQSMWERLVYRFIQHFQAIHMVLLVAHLWQHLMLQESSDFSMQQNQESL